MDIEEADENLIASSCNKHQSISRFSDYSSKVNWYVFALICVFTLGEYI